MSLPDDIVYWGILTNKECFAAVVKNKKGPSNGSLYTEEDWNDESSLTVSPYMYSKVGHGTTANAESMLPWQPERLKCFPKEIQLLIL